VIFNYFSVRFNGKRTDQSDGERKNKNTINDQMSFSFFRTASWAFTAPILCMWSDPIMIRRHAKYRPKRSIVWRHFGHLAHPQLPGNAQNDQRRFLFFRTASRPFAALILCMWSDPIMIRPHAKYHCQMGVFDQALQLRRPWSSSSGTQSVYTILLKYNTLPL
jgi:hypothetical protein